MKIVDRISLNFEQSKRFKGIKFKKGGAFHIFLKKEIKRDAEQYEAVFEEG